MPLVQLITNLPKESIPQDFNLKLSRVVTECLKWPDEQYITVHILADQDFIRGGDLVASCATLKISVCRIGADAERNRQITKTLFEFLSKNLGIPQERIAVILIPLLDECVGLPHGGIVKDLP